MIIVQLSRTLFFSSNRKNALFETKAALKILKTKGYQYFVPKPISWLPTLSLIEISNWSSYLLFIDNNAEIASAASDERYYSNEKLATCWLNN